MRAITTLSYFGNLLTERDTLVVDLLALPNSLDRLRYIGPSEDKSDGFVIYKYSLKYYNERINTCLLIYIGLGIYYYKKSSLNRSLDLLNNLGDLYLSLRVVVLYLYILFDLEVKLLFGFLYSRAR